MSLYKVVRVTFLGRLRTTLKQVVLRKVVLNCLINPLTTIAQVPNGELVNNESFHTIMRNMYEEIIEAFGEDFVELSWDAWF